jgi:hypothetical protein
MSEPTEATFYFRSPLRRLPSKRLLTIAGCEFADRSINSIGDRGTNKCRQCVSLLLQNLDRLFLTHQPYFVTDVNA